MKVGTRQRLRKATSRAKGIAHLAVLAAAALQASAAWGQTRGPNQEVDDRRCLQCHGQVHIAEMGPADRRGMVGTWLDTEKPAPVTPEAVEPLHGDEPATRPGLLVNRLDFASGPHAGVRCVECHEDAARLPHAATLQKATCAAACHERAVKDYEGGSHRLAQQRQDPLAPTCTSCHGAHDILRISDRQAPQYKLNSLFLCGDCHKQHTAKTGNGDPSRNVENYLDSAHARAVTRSGLPMAATCSDCHGAHGVKPSKDPASQVHRSAIPQTCGRCHVGVAEVYALSVHGQKHAENNGKAAVCTDCHTAHEITLASSPGFLVDVIKECGRCHDTADPTNGRLGSYYESYHRSYHGQVTRLGGGRAARCSDCHGAHDIRPLDDPGSRVSSANLIATCAACHPAANANFVKFDPHADHRDARNYPVLYGVWLYFMIMMSAVFTFFGVHTLMWLLRSLVDRRKGGPKPAHGHAATALRRFTGLNRVNHALVAITFFGLTATGIPLVFSGQRWAQVLANVLGGIEAAGLWHRFFAILLIINFIAHFIGLGLAFLRRKEPWHVWLLGPNSLMPRWKDVTDCVGMWLWFFGRRRRPSFDRWTYWEKFDYWAEVFGSLIIGGSGLLLWFPELASRLLPGWAFNIAMIIHGYEALLAIGFIFTIHFFNAHVRPGTFPVDEVMFTGSMPEHEMQESRPEEYARLVERGELEQLRVPAPDRRRRPLWIVIAILSVGLGVALLTLIVLGGLELI